jgi:hypothetical protein
VKRSAAIAFLAVFLAFSWQWAVVHAAFQGNWTALFCAGDRFSRPPEIQYREYVFNGIAGYDGQFSQVIAHDPILLRRYDAFVDAPRLRYRRILMPALAFLFAAGQPDLIDAAYIAVCLMFIGLGTFRLARLAADAGRSEWWGLLFLITPATLTGIERMTVDISVSALALASLLIARKQRWLLLWFALAAAMLSKETGVFVVIAVVAWLAKQKKVRLAALLTTSLLPALAWYVFIQTHTTVDYNDFQFRFVSAYFSALTLPLSPGMVAMVFRIATLGAVIGLLWAAIRSIVLAVQDRFRNLEVLLSFLFAALVLVFQSDAIWADPNGFTRIFSPLLVCLIAATWKKGFNQTLALFALVACPLCLQLAAHLAGPLIRSAAATPTAVGSTIVFCGLQWMSRGDEKPASSPTIDDRRFFDSGDENRPVPVR